MAEARALNAAVDFPSLERGALFGGLSYDFSSKWVLAIV
jgi:hypothetical protein